MREAEWKTETLSDSVVLEQQKNHFIVTPACIEDVEYSREKIETHPGWENTANIQVNTFDSESYSSFKVTTGISTLPSNLRKPSTELTGLS